MIQIKHRYTGAVLKEVDGADLRGANLYRATLEGATLEDENLRNADLRNADLRNADLRNADLRNADLRYAYLDGANLDGAYLPDGSTTETYDPAPVFAGAKPVPAEAFTCNSWENCPLHHAYGATSLADVPKAVRTAATLWLALYDGKHPCALRGLIA